MTEIHPMFDTKKFEQTPTPRGGSASKAEVSSMLTSGLARVRSAGPMGMTWAELGELEHLHHGRASHVLSTLHSKGMVVRLSKRVASRSNSGVYVAPEFVEGRETEKYGRGKSTAQKRIEELEREVEMFRSRASLVDDLEAKIRNLESQVHGAPSQDELNTVYARLEAASIRIENLANELDATAHARDVANQKLDEANRRIDALAELNKTLKDRIEGQTASLPTLNADEAAFVDKVKKAITGKVDTAVQPTRVASLRALTTLVERLPRS